MLPSEEASTDVKAGSTEYVRLSLRRGGHTISGRVMDSGVGPIPGARVTAVLAAREPGRMVSRFVASAGSDGSYSLSLSPDQYSLAATADGYTRSSRALTLWSDANVDFTLQPDSQLSGRVLHKKTREPIAGALVQAFPKRWTVTIIRRCDPTPIVFRIPRSGQTRTVELQMRRGFGPDGSR